MRSLRKLHIGHHKLRKTPPPRRVKVAWHCQFGLEKRKNNKESEQDKVSDGFYKDDVEIAVAVSCFCRYFHGSIVPM